MQAYENDRKAYDVYSEGYRIVSKQRNVLEKLKKIFLNEVLRKDIEKFAPLLDEINDCLEEKY